MLLKCFFKDATNYLLSCHSSYVFFITSIYIYIYIYVYVCKLGLCTGEHTEHT